jgi:hypothetical protein
MFIAVKKPLLFASDLVDIFYQQMMQKVLFQYVFLLKSNSDNKVLREPLVNVFGKGNFMS